MRLDFSTEGQVSVTMPKFMDQLLADLPDNMAGTNTTPAPHYLFNVDPSAPKLPAADKDRFHTLVAKLLYLSKRTHPDIATPVAFLTTRDNAPDRQDYNKLQRCLRYLCGTRDLALTLSADDPGKIRWYVDASFAVHPDMKSHTGAIMTLGKRRRYLLLYTAEDQH